MKPPLRILHLEDDANDAELVQATLEAGSISCVTHRVHTRDEFETALEGGEVDLILSDYSMPAFDGLSALRIANARRPDLPLIFVSGTLGEERAIESLKSGATDYILKGRLGRLAPAVERAMQEVGARRERERLEARFIEAQKMDVIGQLAGGVAHDFNNVLAVIIGYNELLLADLDPKSSSYECAEQIRDASERAAGLTKQLLVFSRKQSVQPVVLDLEKTVQKLEGMLGRLVGESIDLKIAPGAHGRFIRADSGYIGQVVMNLVVNARDAMPLGGKLTIEFDDVTLDQDYADAHPGEEVGDFVRLSVSDTGCGMTEEVKARLFETFFTTKPVGKGTGLGLATCQSIVRRCEGHISVSSELGKGSTFHIYFPRFESPFLERDEPNQIAPPKGGTETLLVVEDEASLGKLARTILEKLGYSVLSASNGCDGLRTARAHTGEPIALVVTDVIMPLMGGKMMADELAIDHPLLKILFVSGYTDDAIAHHGVLNRGVDLLLKPYTPAEFARKVRELLDRPFITRHQTLETVNQRMLGPAADNRSAAYSLEA